MTRASRFPWVVVPLLIIPVAGIVGAAVSPARPQVVTVPPRPSVGEAMVAPDTNDRTVPVAEEEPVGEKCCAALRQNAKSAPPQQVAFYLASAGACDAMTTESRKNATPRLRALLSGATLPPSCRGAR